METRTANARRLLLGREIDYMIRTRGISQTEAGRIIEVGQQRINAIVQGIGTISVGDLKELARGLGFDNEEYLASLLELRRDNHRRGFWSTGHRRGYLSELRLYVDLECQAESLRETASEIIPGLLQHPDYIWALHSSSEQIPPDGMSKAHDYVEARIARQSAMTERATKYHAILSESCLRRTYGSTAVMCTQLNHLIELSRRDNVHLQVMPFSHALPRAGMEDRFVLLRVPSPGRAGALDMAIVEAQGEIRYIDDKDAIDRRERVFARLSGAALSQSASRAFMHKIVSDTACLEPVCD
ncbi:helix-turn-helix domain-containing protein [Nocardia sp. NPDC003963]